MKVWNSIRWIVPLIAMVAATQLSAQYTASAITNDYAGNDISATGMPVPFTASSLPQSEHVSMSYGFNFDFYGKRYTDALGYNGVWVSNSGFVTFGSSGVAPYPTASLPNPTVPNNAIYACQTLLTVDTAVGDGVWTRRLFSPERFIIQWKAKHSVTQEQVDFVIVLFPNDTIEVHFGPSTNLAGAHPSLPPGMGIENDDGTVGVVPPGGYRQMPTTTTAFRYELPPVDLDVVDVVPESVGPFPSPYDVHVVVKNHGSQPFTGTIDVEYSVNGGTPLSQTVVLTNVLHDEQSIVTFTGGSSWAVTPGSHNIVGAINPPATGDPDAPDELNVQFEVDSQSYYRTYTISNNFAANDIAATGTPIPFGLGTNPSPKFVALPGGFKFPFYGVLHSGVWANSSGLLDFSGVGSSLPASVRVTPTPTVPDPAEMNHVIYACQAALRYTQPGQGAWTQLLTGPERFVIHYKAEHFTALNGTVEFVIVLYESGAIEIHFASSTNLGGADPNFPPAMGIENQDGTVGLAAPGGWRQFPTPTTAYRYELPPTDLDVVDIRTDPTWPPPAGANDVQVVIVNNGSQSFTGSVDVEYSIDGGASVTQAVSITDLLPGERHTAVFTGANAWDVAAGFHDMRGAINPPVAGDLDAVDEFIVQQVKGGGAWTQHAPTGHWSSRSGHSTVVFNGKIWVMGGVDNTFTHFNDVWSSTDGVNWTQETAAAPWPARTLHASVVFNNEIWVLGGLNYLAGEYGDVWSSPDGVNWTQHAATGQTGHWSARTGLQTVVFNNRLWVLGGLGLMSSSVLNDVWSSVDGVNWVQESTAAGWSGRGIGDSVVFDNRMWMLGGSDLTLNNGKNDVWSSTDGVNWTAETTAAPWTRLGHTTAVFNNRIWVMGGRHAGENANDVWSSPDGANWVRETGSAPWSKRNFHTSAVFSDRLWLLGGVGNSPNNEVWSYTEAPQITSSPPTTAIVGNLYTYDVVVSTAATTFSASGLPTWLTLSGNTLSGTPGPSDVGLTGVITITATNAEGSFDQEFQIDVQGMAPQITSTPVGTAQVNQPYSYTVTATGTPAPTLSASGLPPWASFDVNTGELTGTPGTSDEGTSSTVTITATNGIAPDAVQTFTITVPSSNDGGGSSGNGGSGCVSSARGPLIPLGLIALMLGGLVWLRGRGRTAKARVG